MVSYILDGENGYRRYQGGLLCENVMVFDFKAVLTNLDAIPGIETLRCRGGERYPASNLSLEAEVNYKDDAEQLFYAICQSNLTRIANITLKGRNMGTIRRTCDKGWGHH